MRCPLVPRLVALVTLVATPALGGCFPRIANYGDPGDQPEPGQAMDGGLFPFQSGQEPVATERILAFIVATNPFLTADLARREADVIARQAADHGVPTTLLLGLIATESSFNPRAVSPVGAQGLGQLMPPTWRDMGISDPFDVDQNVYATARYIAWLGRTWVGHPRRWEMVLASYLAGIGTVSRQLKAGRDLTSEQAAYVKKIFRLTAKV